MSHVKVFQGGSYFRQRILCSTLSGVPIEIQNIHNQENSKSSSDKGLRDYEISFLRLMDSLTQGTRIEINETGTTLQYSPGILLGGSHQLHDCPCSRGICYFLEAICCCCLFCKHDVSIQLTGVTNHPMDISIDYFRNITLFNLSKFLPIDLPPPTLQVLARGAFPLGGGHVVFTCKTIKTLKSLQLLDEGMIKRVRGVCFSTNVSPSLSNRVVEGAKEILYKFIPDVWLFTDHYKGKKAAGKSPGLGLTLQAESDTGCRLGVEFLGESQVVPEDLGKLVSMHLCQEVRRGGCIDSTSQWLIFLLMTLCPQDVSKIRIGTEISEYGIEMLRNLKNFFGVIFKIQDDESSIVLSCVGIGFKNLQRKSN